MPEDFPSFMVGVLVVLPVLFSFSWRRRASSAGGFLMESPNLEPFYDEGLAYDFFANAVGKTEGQPLALLQIADMLVIQVHGVVAQLDRANVS